MIALADNPPTRFTSPAEQTGDACPWWIAHTKSRSEKALAWDLLAKEIGFFLPMTNSIIISGGRRRHVKKPLFPSYVFFRGDAEARQEALTTGRLCQVIPVSNQLQIQREIASLQTAVEQGQLMDSYPQAAVGRRCKVISGGMQGVEGIVLEHGKMAKVVLQITTLGRGVLLEVDVALLESID